MQRTAPADNEETCAGLRRSSEERGAGRRRGPPCGGPVRLAAWLGLCHGAVAVPATRAAAAGFAASVGDGRQVDPYSLPELGFPYEALEGRFVSAKTMHLHHDKHHATYVAMLNEALASQEFKAPAEVEELLRSLSTVPEPIRRAVRNHGGGHLNHINFWKWLRPGGPEIPKGNVAAQIQADFGSFDKFKQVFSKEAMGRFGSGWCWVVLAPSGKLEVCSTANQDNPVMDADVGCIGEPILGLDVWEHAYYVDYENLRKKYIAAFWSAVNWGEVEEKLRSARAARSRGAHRGDGSGTSRVSAVAFAAAVALTLVA